MTAFVTVDQYADATQTSVTSGAVEAAVDIALDAACAEIRAYCSQLFDLVVDDEITLSGNGRQLVLLPQLPIVAINSVTLDDEEITDYVLLAEDGILYREDRWTRGVGNIVVDYDHGYETIPADLVNVAIQRARGVVNARTPGIQSESIDGYSYTLEAGGSANDLDPYAKVLDHYKIRRSPVA